MRCSSPHRAYVVLGTLPQRVLARESLAELIEAGTRGFSGTIRVGDQLTQAVPFRSLAPNTGADVSAP